MKLAFELFKNDRKGILEIKLSSFIRRDKIPIVNAAIMQHTDLEWKKRLTHSPEGELIAKGEVKVPIIPRVEPKFTNPPRIIEKPKAAEK